MSNAVGEEVHPIHATNFAVALSWDESVSCDLDVDLQAVLFDSSGKLLDAVYYNNIKALGVAHSGDEMTGAKSGYDEVIWVHFRKIPDNVRAVLFVVACHSGGHLRDVVNGRMHLLEDSLDNEVAAYRLERSEADVDLVGALLRGEDGSWSFHVVEEPAEEGDHFMDILEPVIGNYVRKAIPGAPRRIKAAFTMEKGSVVDLPKVQDLRTLVAGLGWDVDAGKVDLDVSAVMLTAAGEVRDACYFGNLEVQGAQHSGDNLTGEGDGDDEQITLDLQALTRDVSQVFFLINVYTKGKTFRQVANPYCRIFSETGDELAKYELRDAGTEQGVIVARLLLDAASGRWSFQALGSPCSGNTFKDSLPEVKRLFGVPPRSFQVRSLSSASIWEPSAAEPSAAEERVVQAPAMPPSMPPPQPKSSTCAMM